MLQLIIFLFFVQIRSEVTEEEVNYFEELFIKTNLDASSYQTDSDARSYEPKFPLISCKENKSYKRASLKNIQFSCFS